MKDHEIAKVVNELRDVAIRFHDTQQLRERIANIVVPLLAAQSTAALEGDERRPALPHPDTTFFAQWAGHSLTYHSDDQIIEYANARVKAALASRPAVSEPVVGWKLVPITPTSEMLANAYGPGQGGFSVAYAIKNWQDMLDAAPPSQHAEGGETKRFPTPISISTDKICEIASKYNLGNPRLDALRCFVNEIIIVNEAEYAKSE